MCSHMLRVRTLTGCQLLKLVPSMLEKIYSEQIWNFFFFSYLNTNLFIIVSPPLDVESFENSETEQHFAFGILQLFCGIYKKSAEQPQCSSQDCPRLHPYTTGASLLMDAKKMENKPFQASHEDCASVILQKTAASCRKPKLSEHLFA